MPVLSIRIDLADGFRLGPGKVRLMELIAEHGSISAAGRAMGMSYRRAWLLVESLNGAFCEPLVVTQTGGSRGGGAGLTKLGHSIVARYRSIEAAATATAGPHLRVLASALLPAGC
jgi:molybdate transport system regulatory protein